MSSDRPTLPEPCTTSRATIQEILDGPVAAERREALERHLAVCDRCRDYRDGMQTVRAALRGLPEIPLPDDALEEVWSRAADAEPPAPKIVRGRFGWRIPAAVAAAILMTALLFLWVQTQTPPGEGTAAVAQGEPAAAPTSKEIERAAREARQVLELTAQALQRSRLAADRVLTGEVSPALQRVPIRWPESPSTADRRSKT